MAEASMYGVGKNTIVDMAIRRGFNIAYESNQSLKISRFCKPAQLIKQHEPRVIRAEKAPHKFDAMVDGFLADASKSYVKVDDFMAKHGISKAVFAKLVARVRYVLNGQQLESLNSEFEPRVAKQQTCYYRLK